MPKWLIKLKGDSGDLESLSEYLQSPEQNVLEDSGSYYLHSSEFDSLNTPNEVYERGKALVELVNFSANLYLNDFQDIAEDGVALFEDDGERRHYTFLEVTFRTHTRARAKITIIKPDGTELLIEHPINYCLQVAQRDTSVLNALRDFGKGTWVNLYMVYEVIKDDVGGYNNIINNGLATESELKHFKRTAQCHRHARAKYTPPSKPMALSDAQSFIKDMLRVWVRSKE